MAFYKSIAPFYDYIFPPSDAQADFIARNAGGLVDKRILEAGCGTGNLTLKLAGKGAFVEGIDLDEEMIGRAIEKTNSVQNISCRKLDVLEIDREWSSDYFDAVVCLGNMLVHLPNEDFVQSFFEKARKVLRQNGILIVQIINYDRILDHNISGLPTIENDYIRFERYYDKKDKHLDFRTVLTVKRTGEVIKNVVSLYPIRKQQIQELLVNAGFGNIRFYGNFNEGELTERSTPLVFRAQPSLIF